LRGGCRHGITGLKPDDTLPPNRGLLLQPQLTPLEIKNIVLQEKYDLLVYKRFLRTSETQDETQPALFDEAAAESGTGKEDGAEKETITCQRNKRKAGRKPLPENPTQEERINDLPEEEKTCICGRRLAPVQYLSQIFQIFIELMKF
jgi:hypothetical protein